MPSKLRRNYVIKCAYFLRFQRWYICLNPCTIDGDVITTWIFTGFGKSVCRVIWRGFWHCLERRTSGLVIVESIRVLGLSFNSQKKTSFVQDSRISYWLQLVCPISPLLLYGFQSNLVSLERYFRGESNAVCYEGRGLLFMENIGNYRNCATRIIVESLDIIGCDCRFFLNTMYMLVCKKKRTFMDIRIPPSFFLVVDCVLDLSCARALCDTY